jgi:hypothetical protein
MDMRSSPRRSVVASVATGCCLAAAVVAGGYAASGAMPFSEWPGTLFSSKGAEQVALAPVHRAAAPVLTLPAREPERGERTATRVIPLDDATTAAPRRSAPKAPARRTTTSAPKAPTRRTPRRDTHDSSPTTAPTPSTPSTPSTETPVATAASPAGEGPVQSAAPVPAPRPSTRRVKLGDVSTSFASASSSASGQPELRVTMAVADTSQATPATKTVALSLKLAPTDVQALMRAAATMSSSPIALETQVDVVDATVQAAGRPACTDGKCLRVQMKFAPDTRPNPADQPEVQLLDDGDAISNTVKVVVKINPEDLPKRPVPGSAPPAEPAPPDDTPSVLSLPLRDQTDPQTPAAPATDTTTVALPDTTPQQGAPEVPAVKVQAELEVVDTPDPADQPAPAEPQQPAAAATAPADDCP